MADRVEELLHRRTDLSTFLVHLSRTSNQVTARERLLTILSERRLRAGEPFGMGTALVQTHPEIASSQRVVCFTETPLEHAWMQCRQIEGRQLQFEPYGVAVTRTWGRLKGANPVMYIDISPTGHDWLTNPINKLVEAAQAGKQVIKEGDEWITPPLANSPILRLLPFFEQMGKPSGVRKEFWWEREWRHVGDVTFGSWSDIVVVLAPEDDHGMFRQDLTQRLAQTQPPPPAGAERLSIVDPRWGLERIIAALAGVPVNAAGPFPT